MNFGLVIVGKYDFVVTEVMLVGKVYDRRFVAFTDVMFRVRVTVSVVV